MKKRALLTLALNGLSHSLSKSVKTIEDYCRKYKIDFYMQTQPVINGPHIYHEKFKFVELLDLYEQVCYLDLDTLITPHARNIFDIYNNKEYFYAFEENGNTPGMCRNEYVKPLLLHCDDWPLNNIGKYRYFNAGVFVVSHLHKKYFEKFRDIPNIDKIDSFGDQTYLNYLVTKNNIPFQTLDHSFNRMYLNQPDFQNKRLTADIIHYAGHYDKTSIINSDFQYLYETI